MNESRDKVTMISISRATYNQLIEDAQWLSCLEEAGVDNWQGFDEARAIYREWYGKAEVEG